MVPSAFPSCCLSLSKRDALVIRLILERETLVPCKGDVALPGRESKMWGAEKDSREPVGEQRCVSMVPACSSHAEGLALHSPHATGGTAAQLEARPVAKQPPPLVSLHGDVMTTRPTAVRCKVHKEICC